MSKSLRIVFCVIAICAAISLTLVKISPAQADNGTIPTGAPGGPTCTSGQPKLDYQVDSNSGTNIYWANVCGTGQWTWQADIPNFVHFNILNAVRMPTSPYHRIWLHENANDTGGAVCLYSTGNDIFMDNLVGSGTDPSWIWWPANIQVSANTAPC